jgi:hypothetical protein
MAESKAGALAEKEQGNAAYKSKNFAKVAQCVVAS